MAIIATLIMLMRYRMRICENEQAGDEDHHDECSERRGMRCKGFELQAAWAICEEASLPVAASFREVQRTLPSWNSLRFFLPGVLEPNTFRSMANEERSSNKFQGLR